MSESHTADLATRARYRQEGADYEQERIIKLLQGLSNPAIPMGELHIPGFQIREVIALIKIEQADHLGEAIRATAWAYTEGERPNPLIKGEQ